MYIMSNGLQRYPWFMTKKYVRQDSFSIFKKEGCYENARSNEELVSRLAARLSLGNKPVRQGKACIVIAF